MLTDDSLLAVAATKTGRIASSSQSTVDIINLAESGLTNIAKPFVFPFPTNPC